MSAFEDFKDQAKTRLLILGDRIQESPAYIELKDRYENLNPRMQMLVRLFIGLLVFLLLFTVVKSPLNTANENIASYQEKRELLRSLFKTSRASLDVPAIPTAPAIESIRFQLDSYFRQIGLIDSQMAGMFQDPITGNLIPNTMSDGSLRVQLNKLNLRQITDISHRLTNVSPSIKITDMSMNANLEDSRYYDVTWKMVALKVPALPPPPANEDDSKTPKKGRR